MPAPRYSLRADAGVYGAGFVLNHSQVQAMAKVLCSEYSIAQCHNDHYVALVLQVRKMDATVLRRDYWDTVAPTTRDTRYLFIIDFIPGLRDGPAPKTGWSDDTTRAKWWTKFGSVEGVQDAEIDLMQYPLIAALPEFMGKRLRQQLEHRPELRKYFRLTQRYTHAEIAEPDAC